MEFTTPLTFLPAPTPRSETSVVVAANSVSPSGVGEENPGAVSGPIQPRRAESAASLSPFESAGDRPGSAVEFSRDQLEEDAARLNERVSEDLPVNSLARAYAAQPLPQRRLQFSVSDETGRTVIRVFDKETGEIVREIPPDEASDMLTRESPGNYLVTTTV